MLIGAPDWGAGGIEMLFLLAGPMILLGVVIGGTLMAAIRRARTARLPVDHEVEELPGTVPCPQCGRRNAMTTRICPRCCNHIEPQKPPSTRHNTLW
jgi:hypothetical protein